MALSTARLHTWHERVVWEDTHEELSIHTQQQCSHIPFAHSQIYMWSRNPASINAHLGWDL